MPCIDNSFGEIDAVSLADALASLEQVSSEDDFLAWSHTDTQSILPHRAFLAVTGKVFHFAIKPLAMISLNIPDEWLARPGANSARYQAFWMRRWLQSGEPQLYDLARDGAAFGAGTLRSFRASGLQNVAAHGLFDVHRDQLTLFSFHGMPLPPGPVQGKLLKLLVSGMHDALLRCMRPCANPQARFASQGQFLREREDEVLSWTGQGKRDSEIASILNLLDSTVKNQAQTILLKMSFNTARRASAQGVRRCLIQ